MKKFLLIVSILCGLLITTTHAATFPDVPETHDNYAAIESLVNLNIVNGYPDGTFGPDIILNRAEALKMILISAEIPSSEEFLKTGFPDVPLESWFSEYVVKAESLGIINGNPDGTFTPERKVNKAEFLKMILESFNVDLSQHMNVSEALSNDTYPGEWYLPYLSYAKTIGLISPTSTNLLMPDESLSRADCAEIVYKLLIVVRGGDVQKMLSIAESNLVSVVVELNDNDIEKAVEYANSAVFYTEKALEMNPEEGIVRAANKIALGFQKLTLAYIAGLEGQNDDLIQLVEEAKTLAGEAYDEDPSTQPLGKKIKEQGDILLLQIQ
ncbi:S-layer homology domain-containing protein [Patescibacteria group bacterium]